MTRILHDDANMQHATNFFHRYQQLFIGASVVREILELRRQHSFDPDTAKALFSQKRQVWEQRGGYLEVITVKRISSWIASDSYIVAEAGESDADGKGNFIPVAQCVYQLPDSDWVIPRLTEPLDDIFDYELYETILEDGPRASALCDYVGVLPEWSGKRLAGAARYAGVQEIIRQNAIRLVDSQIRHIGGVVFAIQGIEALNSDETEAFGRSLQLTKHLGEEELVNRASISSINSGKRFSAHMVGKWKSAPTVPIRLNGWPYCLHVHWYFYAQRL